MTGHGRRELVIGASASFRYVASRRVASRRETGERLSRKKVKNVRRLAKNVSYRALSQSWSRGGRGPHSPFGLAVSISTPVSVTSRVCSHCAVHFPSLVTAVHPSFHMASAVLPMVSMGSIVNVCPTRRVPASLFLWCRTVGPEWNSLPTPCPTNFSTTP